MKRLMTLSIIIPVYNEEKTIGQVIDRVRRVKIAGVKKEIIVVDDASTDKSLDKVLKKRRLDRGTIKVHLSLINLGKGAAVRLGLNLATGDIAIVQDADLELDPRDYQKILTPLLEGRAEVVYGSRFLANNKNIPLKTKLANWWLTGLVNVLYGSGLTDMETAYKAFRMRVIAGMRLRALEFEFEPEITCRLLEKNVNIFEVPIKYRPRTKDEGKKIDWFDGVEAIYTILKLRFGKR